MVTRILHLTLLRVWFEQIASGQKTQEYREIKPYWIKRLRERTYDEVWFKNGYSKDAPFMRVEYKGLKEENNRFVIQLGEVLEIKNFKQV
jgi:hypothetical protein